MNCAYHPDKSAVGQCSQCQKHLCDQCALPEASQAFICTRCAALMAVEDVVTGFNQRQEDKAARKQIEKEKRNFRGRLRIASQGVLFVIAAVVMSMQAPRIIAGLKDDKPIRSGTYATDAKTDQCIDTLWQISKLLQEGSLPGKDAVCPVSKKPYGFTTVRGNLVVRCANPERHGFREMRVSKRAPGPVIIK
jgi:hypothetical protein